MPGSSVVLPTGENAPSLIQQPSSIVSQNAGFLGPSMLSEPLLTDHALPHDENAYMDPKRVRLNEGDGSAADKRVGKRELMRAGVQRFYASTSLFKMCVWVERELEPSHKDLRALRKSRATRRSSTRFSSRSSSASDATTLTSRAPRRAGVAKSR